MELARMENEGSPTIWRLTLRHQTKARRRELHSHNDPSCLRPAAYLVPRPPNQQHRHEYLHQEGRQQAEVGGDGIPPRLRDVPRGQPLRPHDQGNPRQEMQDMRNTLHGLRVASGDARSVEEGRDMQDVRPIEERMSGVHIRSAVRPAGAGAGQDPRRGGVRRRRRGGAPERRQPIVDDGAGRAERRAGRGDRGMRPHERRGIDEAPEHGADGTEVRAQPPEAVQLLRQGGVQPGVAVSVQARGASRSERPALEAEHQGSILRQ